MERPGPAIEAAAGIGRGWAGAGDPERMAVEDVERQEHAQQVEAWTDAAMALKHLAHGFPRADAKKAVDHEGPSVRSNIGMRCRRRFPGHSRQIRVQIKYSMNVYG